MGDEHRSTTMGEEMVKSFCDELKVTRVEALSYLEENEWELDAAMEACRTLGVPVNEKFAAEESMYGVGDVPLHSQSELEASIDNIAGSSSVNKQTDSTSTAQSYPQGSGDESSMALTSELMSSKSPPVSSIELPSSTSTVLSYPQGSGDESSMALTSELMSSKGPPVPSIELPSSSMEKSFKEDGLVKWRHLKLRRIIVKPTTGPVSNTTLEVELADGITITLPTWGKLSLKDICKATEKLFKDDAVTENASVDKYDLFSEKDMLSFCKTTRGNRNQAITWLTFCNGDVKLAVDCYLDQDSPNPKRPNTSTQHSVGFRLTQTKEYGDDENVTEAYKNNSIGEGQGSSTETNTTFRDRSAIREMLMAPVTLHIILSTFNWNWETAEPSQTVDIQLPKSADLRHVHLAIGLLRPPFNSFSFYFMSTDNFEQYTDVTRTIYQIVSSGITTLTQIYHDVSDVTPLGPPLASPEV